MFGQKGDEGSRGFPGPPGPIGLQVGAIHTFSPVQTLQIHTDTIHTESSLHNLIYSHDTATAPPYDLCTAY